MMNDYTSTKFYYYLCIHIAGLAIGAGIIGFIKWPLLAEIPLAISVYLQVVFLGSYLFTNWIEKKSCNFSQLFSDLKLHLKQLEQAENEIS